ncbi:MAG: hypothetical protein DWQ06_14320 [Calditrichaeota bacterium]|nr:MAG: hypothetical protein DWQ06_14320 [Calditrichota bacterium]
MNATNVQILNVDDEWISIPDTTTICFDTKGFRVEADSLGTIKFSSPENQGFIIRKWDESEE